MKYKMFDFFQITLLNIHNSFKYLICIYFAINFQYWILWCSIMQLRGLGYTILMWATVHLLFNIDWKRKLPIGWNFAEVNQIQFRLLSFLLENHIQYYRSIGKLWKKLRLFAYHSIKKLKFFLNFRDHSRKMYFR